MKDLTYKELMEAPAIIQFVYLQSAANNPLGSSIIDEAMKDYPQFFKEELELKRRWDAVPEYIKEAYFNEMMLVRKHYDEKTPHYGKGLLFFIQNREAFNEQMDAQKEQRANIKIDASHIHNKYLASFGIPFNEDLI